jgi:hypothetical protein|uniref:Uncharacterized protein n=1 Tax=viral metagenome TaxID=1070528 RepID=A0A6C0M0T4_9ZZZZ
MIILFFFGSIRREPENIMKMKKIESIRIFIVFQSVFTYTNKEV